MAEADNELIKAVMEDDEPEIQWERAEVLEDATSLDAAEVFPESRGNGWIIRFIDAAIVLVIIVLGFLLFRGF